MTGSTTGPNVPVNAQSNDNAIVDELALGPGMLAWSQTITRASSKVSVVVAAKGVYRSRMSIFYVSAGPATGKVDYILFDWSNDSGASYTLRTDSGASVTLGKLSMSYDGSGNLSGSAWS